MKPVKSSEENLEEKRKIIISQSSLPTSNFSRKKEETAVKMLNSSKLNLGIIKKNYKQSTSVESTTAGVNKIDKNNDSGTDVTSTKRTEPENSEQKHKKFKQHCSLVDDYGSSSDSD